VNRLQSTWGYFFLNLLTTWIASSSSVWVHINSSNWNKQNIITRWFYIFKISNNQCMIKSCWCQDAGLYTNHRWGRRGRDHMVVGFPNYRCSQCLSPLMVWDWTPFRQGVLDTTLWDKVCKWLATGWWVSPVSSTNKTDCHDITKILLKVVLNTINQT
jgi:hypothetical protein